MTTESFYADQEGIEADEADASWKVVRELADDGSVLSEVFQPIKREIMSEVEVEESTATQNEPADESTSTPEDGNNASDNGISPEMQALIDKVVTDRLGRAKRGHEKEKAALQKENDELAKKIAEYEEKDLGELDKLQKKIERLTKDLAEKDQVLSAKDLRILKMESLLAAGATPDQVPKLLKRLSGTTQEEVEADIEELKGMGWIGKPPETQATSPKPAAQGSGHPPVPDKGLKKFTHEQIKGMSTEEYSANREDIMKSLNAGLVT